MMPNQIQPQFSNLSSARKEFQGLITINNQANNQPHSPFKNQVPVSLAIGAKEKIYSPQVNNAQITNAHTSTQNNKNNAYKESYESDDNEQQEPAIPFIFKDIESEYEDRIMPLYDNLKRKNRTHGRK